MTATTSVARPGDASLAIRPIGIVRKQPVLAILGLLFLAALVPTGAAAMLDPGTFDGVNQWLKPMKFQASLGVFLLTLAWSAGYLTPGPRVTRALRWIVPLAVVTSLFEASYITWQAAHGRASHWNMTDPLHRVLWALMGIGAVLLSYTAFALALLLRRHCNPQLAPAFRLSLVLGLALTFILGALTGIVMAVAGSHFVNHLAFEPGLPVLGWSTVGGDWRPPHFLGMHAGQVLPAFGAFAGSIGARRGTAAVVVFAGAYTALTLFTLAQAFLNHPVFGSP